MQFSRGKEKLFDKKREITNGEEYFFITNAGFYSISDTFECGQCFRAEKTKDEDGYVEYVTVIGDKILRVGQKKAGELYVFDTDENELDTVVIPYLSLDRDYEAIRADINKNTSSQWLKRAGEYSRGIAILRQDVWEALFSFIISQNNNIPRIKAIIRSISAQYGKCLAIEKGLKKCPFNRTSAIPCEEICKNCGACYSFPSAHDIVENPEKLHLARVGFRYKYLCDAAERVVRGEFDFEKIKAQASYEKTKEELKKIKGVGDKVASCVALFAFENLDAFPVDVWVKRAIDTYFDGELDFLVLGPYAGIAQQYIFHYIKNM